MAKETIGSPTHWGDEKEKLNRMLEEIYSAIEKIDTAKIISPDETKSVEVTNEGTTVNGDLNTSGFTQLGSSAPAVKQKLITGTTTTEGQTNTYATGLAVTQIKSFSVLVTDSINYLRPPFFGVRNQSIEYYLTSITDAGYLEVSVPTGSSGISDRAFTCLITYNE